MKLITGVFLDAKNGEAKVITVPDKLEEYYKMLDCETIDIVTRKINHVPFSIICDDEALLRERPIVSAVDANLQAMLFGNLFVVSAGVTEDGDLISISDKDAALVLDNVRCFLTFGEDGSVTTHRALWPTEYC